MRLLAFLSAAAVMIAIVTGPATTFAADALSADTPTNFDAHFRDRDATVKAEQHMGRAIAKKESSSGQRHRVAYQAACSSSAARKANAYLCRPASPVCVADQRQSLIPMWEMETTAANPGPDDWTSTGTFVCRSALRPDANDAPDPIVTAADFRRLPIPPPRIKIQPDPDTSPTLVNIETNLYTQATPAILPTTVLGQPVRVRATPTQFTWHHGDGTTNTTTDPGAPYPNLTTAHIYENPGRYQVTLATTFTGEFSVAGGPWQPITGTATVTSPGIQITAREARNQLTP